MIRFASLGSGSRGNATLVQAGDTLLLVDCGYTVKELVRRLALLEVHPEQVDALLVTHEHGDHMRGVGAFARRYNVPVWMTHGTWDGARFGRVDLLHLFNSHVGRWVIGDAEIIPATVPHDAREPTQFVIRQGSLSLGLLTDLGSYTPYLVGIYGNVDALLLECNHDQRMLAEGPYPPRLQARVGGNYGHLNNLQAAAFLSEIEHSGLRHLVAAHLSEKNNQPGLAHSALCEAVPEIDSRLSLLVQEQISDWFVVD